MTGINKFTNSNYFDSINKLSVDFSNLKTLFEKYDIDKNGVIDSKELRVFLDDWCESENKPMVDDTQLQKFLTYLDSTKKGVLTLQDFSRWAIKFSDSFKWKKIREFFTKYSHDKKTLDHHDLHLFLDDLSKTYKLPKPSMEQISLFFDKIDTNHSGKISYQEFHDWIENLEKGFKKEFNVRQLFDLFDKDSNGHLDSEEFDNFLNYLVKVYHIPNPTEEQKEMFMNKIDKDKNGEIEFDEFEPFYNNLISKLKK